MNLAAFTLISVAVACMASYHGANAQSAKIEFHYDYPPPPPIVKNLLANQRSLLGQGSAAAGGLGFVLQLSNSPLYSFLGKLLQGFGVSLGTFDYLFEYIPIIGEYIG